MQIYCKIGTLPRSKICMLSQNVMGCGSEETTVSHPKSPLIRTAPHPHTAGQTPGDEQERQSEGFAAGPGPRPGVEGWGRAVQRCPAAASTTEREGPFPEQPFCIYC